LFILVVKRRGEPISTSMVSTIPCTQRYIKQHNEELDVNTRLAIIMKIDVDVENVVSLTSLVTVLNCLVYSYTFV